MRILSLGLLAAAALLPATAQAQPYRYYDRDDRRDYREYQRDVRQAVRECRRDLRRADSRREYRRERRDCRRDLREARREYRRDLRDNRHGHYDRSYSGLGYYGHDPYYGQRTYRERYWDGYAWRYRY